MPSSATVIAAMPAFLFMLVFLEACHGREVYKVGDSAGWTIIGNINYTAWSSSKSFHFGDTILFVYNKQFHNVVEVSKADYRTCNASNPISTHNSGNDSVLLNHKGHFFFLCGVDNHCQMGQKVDIRIPKNYSVGPVKNNTTSTTTTPLLPLPPSSPPAPALPLVSRGFRCVCRLALGIFCAVMIGFGV